MSGMMHVLPQSLDNSLHTALVAVGKQLSIQNLSILSHQSSYSGRVEDVLFVFCFLQCSFEASGVTFYYHYYFSLRTCVFLHFGNVYLSSLKCSPPLCLSSILILSFRNISQVYIGACYSSLFQIFNLLISLHLLSECLVFFFF